MKIMKHTSMGQLVTGHYQRSLPLLNKLLPDIVLPVCHMLWIYIGYADTPDQFVASMIREPSTQDMNARNCWFLMPLLKPQPITVRNPQANSILERAVHGVIRVDS